MVRSHSIFENIRSNSSELSEKSAHEQMIEIWEMADLEHSAWGANPWARQSAKFSNISDSLDNVDSYPGIIFFRRILLPGQKSFRKEKPIKDFLVNKKN